MTSQLSQNSYAHLFNDAHSFRTDILKENVFCFELENNQPIKLGDGSFGVVYQIRDQNWEKFAVKILYESKAFEKAEFLPAIDEEVIQLFASEFEIDRNDPVIKSLYDISKSSSGFGNFSLELFKAVDGNAQYYKSLLSKVLKEHQSIPVERFTDEIKVSRLIRENFEASKQDVHIEGIVDTIGGTHQFHASEAYRNLKSSFEKSLVKLSNYALVMPFYDWTLKDLLEDGIEKYHIRKTSNLLGVIPKDDLSPYRLSASSKKDLEDEVDKMEIDIRYRDILKSNIYELTGYDILDSMNYEKRICTILAYLIRITIGLNALYAADFSHFDLKPANIFVKDSRIFDVVIGDLGFLKPEEAANETILNTGQNPLPLGTRHYRSPEQKDYFDICNVEIVQANDLVGHERPKFIVRDPKFGDTIIEDKDFLVFSKDKSHTKYEIDEITKSAAGIITITLKLNTKAQKQFVAEKQTQVILYKRQSVRTDLFGLGAIAFDMLTCGKSPEHFYNNLRAYDHETEDISTLMQMYHAVANFQSNEPRLVHVFEPFKHSKLPYYAPPQIVEFILKCMLYKAKNTFYDLNKNKATHFERHTAVIDAALQYLLDLSKTNFPAIYDENPLQMRRFEPIHRSQSSILSQEIRRLQHIPVEELPLRLTRGVCYFKEIVQLLSKTLKNDEIFFAELLPSNITTSDTGMGFYFTVYKNEASYRQDLKNDIVYTKINQSIDNSYVPDSLCFMRRPICLEKTTENHLFRYTFTNSSLLGNNVAKGDWIVMNSRLFEITAVHNFKWLELKAVNDMEPTEYDIEENEDTHQSFNIHDNETIECFYYANLNPCIYYLKMLGIYLYQLFFVGLGDATSDKPLIVNIAQSRMSMTSGGKRAVRIKNGHISNREQSEVSIDLIFQKICQMYLKLTFPSEKNSFYKAANNDNDRIIAVASELEKLQHMIGDFIGIPAVALADYLDRDFKLETKETLKAERKFFKEFPKRLEFNHLIQSLLAIDLSDRACYRENASLPERLQGIINLPVQEILPVVQDILAKEHLSYPQSLDNLDEEDPSE
ncbi:hypothetical protein D0962_30360 [Leptolyngbyaceae cyanobacterium CCMR0082]|uniref:Protein kinase domain-containing protein n=1 Tax=Adonisia turfae CCMR0082 TaxID=2304604 RepID=A0A6M0SEU9_9CYAN|nr:hypothetical protein [Adonisia turfae]NEZ67005.1 hypothetical protein [Adonisia turfae CCMR0082]